MVENYLEIMAEIRKHLKKLAYVIQTEATFTFLDIKLHNKARIDDVLCCVEANFPLVYRNLVRLPKHKEYKSVEMYHSIKHIIQRKWPLSSSMYMVQYAVAVSYINSFMKVLEYDLKKIEASSVTE